MADLFKSCACASEPEWIVSAATQIPLCERDDVDVAMAATLQRGYRQLRRSFRGSSCEWFLALILQMPPVVVHKFFQPSLGRCVYFFFCDSGEPRRRRNQHRQVFDENLALSELLSKRFICLDVSLQCS